MGNFPFFHSRFFGWSNNKIDVIQISRKKNFNYVWEPYEDMRLKGSCAVGVNMPFWTTERNAARGFKGEERNAQENEKHRCLVNRCGPCQADKSFRLKIMTCLVIVLFLM